MKLTPKEKANELVFKMVERYSIYINPKNINDGLSFCVGFSLSIVDEIVLFYETKKIFYRKDLKYWKEVRSIIDSGKF